MAIQNRRGSYADFDPDKMLPGEIAVITGGDPNTETGKNAYVCFGAGDVASIPAEEAEFGTQEPASQTAGKRISDLEEATDINDADNLILEDDTPKTKRIKFINLIKGLAGRLGITSSQVIHTKSDGTATTVQAELLAQNNNMDNVIQKVGSGSTPGYFPAYGMEGHNIGCTFRQFANVPVSSFAIDGNFYDLVPNNTGNRTNWKIVNMYPSLVNSVWRMTFVIYADGNLYTKYINLSNT